MKAYLGSSSFSISSSDAVAILYAVTHHIENSDDGYLVPACRSALEKIKRKSPSLSKEEATAIGISLNEFIDDLASSGSFAASDLPPHTTENSLRSLAHRFQSQLQRVGVTLRRITE